MFNDDIMVLGIQGIGKTSLILYYIHNRFIPSDIGVEESYIKTIRGATFNELRILDSDSQDFYGTTKRQQVFNCRGMVFCYAINDRASFDLCRDLYDRVHDLRKDISDLVVVGLKCELEDERNVGYDEGLEFSLMIGAKFLEASSAHGVNVEEVFKIFEAKPNPSASETHSPNLNVNNTSKDSNNRQQDHSKANSLTKLKQGAQITSRVSTNQVKKSTEEITTSKVKTASNGKGEGHLKVSKSSDSCCVIV